MSSLYESVGAVCDEEHEGGLIIRHYDKESLPGSNGAKWLTEYIAGNTRLEVLVTNKRALVPLIEDDQDEVMFSWTSRTVPQGLFNVIKNFRDITRQSKNGAANMRVNGNGSAVTRFEVGGVKIFGAISACPVTKGQSEVFMSFEQHNPAVAYVAERLLDWTLEVQMLDHLDVILERERDLLS